eukprot:2489598-Prymnesium_polylepis.1
MELEKRTLFQVNYSQITVPNELFRVRTLKARALTTTDGWHTWAPPTPPAACSPRDKVAALQGTRQYCSDRCKPCPATPLARDRWPSQTPQPNSTGRAICPPPSLGTDIRDRGRATSQKGVAVAQLRLLRVAAQSGFRAKVSGRLIRLEIGLAQSRPRKNCAAQRHAVLRSVCRAGHQMTVTSRRHHHAQDIPFEAARVGRVHLGTAPRRAG